MYRLLPFFPILIFFGIYIFAVDFLTYKNPIVKEKIKQENKFFFSKEKEIISVSLDIINLKKKNTDPEKVETIKLKKKKGENLSTNKQIFVQFGAFSKKETAENLTNNIESLLKKKFKGIELEIIGNEEKKLYKIIYYVDDLSTAKDLCKKSKNLKLDCYVQIRK